MARGSEEPGLEEERLRDLIEVVPLALFRATPRGSWSWGNAAFREIAGASPGEDLAEAITRRVAPEDRESIVRAWQEAMRTGKTYSVEFPLGDSSGRWIRARANPVRDAEGTFAGYAGVLEDITSARRREELLVEESASERERSRRKSEFLAVMSHEIRTPLHGVVGTASLLQSTSLTPEQREYVDLLVHSADATLSVVNNILDLSKIEAGRLELASVEFDLREAVEKAVALFAARAHARGLDLACRIPETLPSTVVGDPDRLRQVLVNLLGNAVKFTEKGEVCVAVSRVDAAEGVPALIRFEVRDTGIGLSEEARERIFEPFGQADATISSRFGGTGLGLAICRQFVRLMGGVLAADGSPGKGSAFWFTAGFPLPAGAAPPPRPAAVEGRRVLLVDNHAATRAALAEFLVAWGARVEEAAGSEGALGALGAAAAAGDPFDAVLLDMHLPRVGESRELVNAMRGDPALAGVKVILATSFGHRSRAEAQKWEGVAAFLPKPARRGDLARCLEAALHGGAGTGDAAPYGRAARPRAPAISPSGAFRVARILVVDDNEVSRRIAVRQLEQRGFLVESAEDGAEAVEAVQRTPYDLIFMDWVMPGMDGGQATRRIREMEEGTGVRVPIVAMTARAMAGDRERCMEPGMDDYVTKPVRFEDLDAVLDRWLTPEEGKAAAPRPAPAREAPATVEEQTLDLSTLTSLSDLGAGEGDIVAELAALFTAEAEPRLERLRAAVAEGDAARLRDEAHGLKGSAASLGAQRLSGIARGLEEGAAAGSVEGAESILRDLEEEFARVGTALEGYLASRPGKGGAAGT